MPERDVPPMPNAYSLTATVRDMGSTERPVARLELIDFTGDTRTVDLSPAMAFNIAIELLHFCRQVGIA